MNKKIILGIIIVGIVGITFSLTNRNSSINPISENYNLEIVGLEEEYSKNGTTRFSLLNSGYGSLCGSYSIGIKMGTTKIPL